MMKRFKGHSRLLLTVMLLMVSALSVHAQSSMELADSIVSNIGINLFDEEIDDVIFQTNEFLTDATFIGGSGGFGGFWSAVWHLERCLPSFWPEVWPTR